MTDKILKNIKVSAIVSTYNSEKFIKRRLDNLLAQSIIDQLEIIVINAGSEQDEDIIVKEYADRYNNIKYIRTIKRETIYCSWNRGIRISEGKYITNANTDDILRDDALEILSNKLDSDETVGLVYADQYITHRSDTSFTDACVFKRQYKLDYSLFRLLWRNIVGSQPMWRASIHFKNNIWFDESYEVTGDSEFEFRVSQKYKLQRIPKVLGIYYRSLDDKNKEFIDRELTRKESLSVKEKNVRVFIATLNDDEFKKIRKKLSFHLHTPRIIYTLFRILINRLIPYKQVPPRIFWYWFASIYYEYIDNLNKAEECCIKYSNSVDNLLITRQLEHLQDLKR